MLNIIFADRDLLVLNKPAGLLSVPGKIHNENLLDRVVSQYPNARLIHRLDMDTSGLIIFALNHASQKSLGQQFEARTIQKTYSALLDGHLKAATGEIHMPLLCDWPNRPRQKTCWLEGKAASTQFHRIRLSDWETIDGTKKPLSIVQLHPKTGRTHQLRVHTLMLGHPILGDRLYFHRGELSRLYLHACSISFSHPSTGEKMTLQSPANFKIHQQAIDISP